MRIAASIIGATTLPPLIVILLSVATTASGTELDLHVLSVVSTLGGIVALWQLPMGIRPRGLVLLVYSPLMLVAIAYFSLWLWCRMYGVCI